MKEWFTKERITAWGQILLGCLLGAMAYPWFLVPNHIAPGGVTGLATVLNYLFGWPVGTASLLMNIPLFLIGYRSMGRTFAVRSLGATVIFSLLIDFLPLQPMTHDPLLGSLFGGVLLGAGGLVRAYSQGAAAAINACGVGTVYPTARYLIELPYPMLGRFEFFLKTEPVEIEDKQFTDVVTFTLVLKTETDVAEFWGMLLSGVRKAAEEYGVDLTVRTSPTETAIDEQIELIRQTAAEKPDVMILSAADYDRCAEATEEAIAAGIGVVAVDTDVNAEGRACFVGSNNYQIGQEMGSQMASYLPEGGKVAVIQHMLTTTTGIDRTRGVIDALTQAGNIEILGSYCCDNSTLRAKEITTALLEDEPDIRGFVCTNEVCNVGAANALVELGMGGKVFVVGCDNSQRQIALLEQNIIQAIVIQRPFNMGYMAVQQAVRVAQGETPEDFVEVACVLITRENMYTQENQKLLFPVMEQ